MTYEVENKYPVDDLENIEVRLAALGYPPQPPVAQRDQYFQHPARNFAETDEALRIRTVGTRNRVTYKGPRLAGPTKTRQEIEFDIAPGEAGRRQMQALLTALGFTPSLEVHKTRQTVEIDWQGVQVEGSLDRVEGLGSFVELEIAADRAGLESAAGPLLALAEHLGLAGPERRSYLEMLLERQGG